MQNQYESRRRVLVHFFAVALTALVGVSSAWADLTFIDLTHEIPTFAPSKNDPTKPDLSNPIGHSKPIAGFYHQAVLYPPDRWPTNEGYFDSAAILIQEHNGTSFNSPNHYINSHESLEPGGIPVNDRKSSESLAVEQLTGRIVLIDVSDRIRKELAKNGGKPSPDNSVTNFTDSSWATVRAQDIDAVADEIDDGVWIVARLGWGQFYASGIEDWDTSPYANALNHPGFTREAIGRLIEIMDAKQVRIAGIAADSLSTDSGAGMKGTDEHYSNAWPAHVRLYQRDILIVENLANLAALARVSQTANQCSLVVGALKHVGGTGGPARVFAACEKRMDKPRIAQRHFRKRHGR